MSYLVKYQCVLNVGVLFCFKCAVSSWRVSVRDMFFTVQELLLFAYLNP